MGRVVGLSWIFCVKRVFVFCLRDLHHLAKTLRTLQKIRSNSTNAYAFCVFSSSHTQIKQTPTKVGVCFMGRVVGFEPTHNGTTIRGLNHLTTPAIYLRRFSASLSISNQVRKSSLYVVAKFNYYFLQLRPVFLALLLSGQIFSLHNFPMHTVRQMQPNTLKK